ncbi:MAG TPA: hypothetical protein PKI93_03855 [Alphaproteobacteria bacterium]|nr:hypothetical protein [Alphaproteobacteria bacterium]HNS43816.1 hypothetical protein [Alphaproteobacteria bacterium]
MNRIQAITGVFGLAALTALQGCATPARSTSQTTAGMERSPAVASEDLKTPVKVDPCLRAGIDARYIADVTPQDVIDAKYKGEEPRFYRAFYLFPYKSPTEGGETAIGALVGGILANGVGKAVGLNGGSRTAGTVAGAIGGGAVGSAFAKESRVGNLTDIKACTNYLDKEMDEKHIREAYPFDIRESTGYYRTPALAPVYNRPYARYLAPDPHQNAFNARCPNGNCNFIQPPAYVPPYRSWGYYR